MLNGYKKLIKVIAAIADGTSQKNLFGTHKHLVDDSGTDIQYHTKDIYTKEMRFIYVFADVLHFINTVGNCLFHSRSGRGKRYLWKNVFFSFMVIYSTIYNQDGKWLKVNK